MRDITKLSLEQIRKIAMGDGCVHDDPYSAVDILYERAKANAELWDEVEVVLLYLPRDASHGVVPAFTFETLRQALASAKAATGAP